MTEPTRDGPEIGHDLITSFQLGQITIEQVRGNEYARQQLNLLREHQGLPPIPPPSYNYFGEAIKFIVVCVLFIIIAGFILGGILSLASTNG